jgi:hypothetical protein
VKFTITHGVAHHALVHHVPRFLHGRLPPHPPAGQALYTLIVFVHSRVTNSGLAAKAIRRLPADLTCPLLVVGTEFTAEAYTALRARGAAFVTARDFHWTDASYEQIRVIIGTKVKLPDYRVPVVRRVLKNTGVPRPAPTHVYAIVRIDSGFADLADRITVKEVVTTATLAEAEVARLNALSAAKGCQYIMQLTRLYAVGTSAGSRTPGSP